jgi:Ca-activated chloride channel family protein
MMAACIAAAVAAQQASPAAPFRAGVDLTTVNATVVDRDGHLVRDLPREAFDLFEDGVLQKVTQFTSERVAVSLGILFDTSDSMFGRRIDQAREAIVRFVAELLDPADEFAILAFNHQPHVLTRWTTERPIAARIMQPLKPWGATAIYDTIIATLPLVEMRNRPRAAIIVLSDGDDTASDSTLRDVRSALLRSDVFVYAVAIDPADRFPINVDINRTALQELTDQSGGRTLVVHDIADTMSALSEIADELNSQYLIGYSSAKAPDGQFHSIRVRVHGKDYRVRARNGYVAAARRPS